MVWLYCHAANSPPVYLVTPNRIRLPYVFLPCRTRSPLHVTTLHIEVASMEGTMNSESGEVDLIEKAYIKLTWGIYPEGSTKNEKRVIRKKASTMDVIDGVLHYKKKNGKRVSSSNFSHRISPSSVSPYIC